MTNNPHRCVIDEAGNYRTLVLMVEQQDGGATPYAYTLKPGETLVEAPPPGNILKPRWDGAEWEETATPEEVEAAKPDVPTPHPSLFDRLRSDVDLLMIAELQREGIL